MMTRDEILKAKARAEAASGPWHVSQDGNGSPWLYVDPDDPIISCDLWDDATFIAAAPRDVIVLADLALLALDLAAALDDIADGCRCRHSDPWAVGQCSCQTKIARDALAAQKEE